MSDDRVQGAAIGAGVGSVLGFGAGSYMAHHQQQHIRDENYTRQGIYNLRQLNAQLRSRNEFLLHRIHQLDSEIAHINQRISMRQATVADRRNRLQSELHVISHERRHLQDMERIFNEEVYRLNISRYSPLPPGLADLRHHIDAIGQSLNRYENQVRLALRYA